LPSGKATALIVTAIFQGVNDAIPQSDNTSISRAVGLKFSPTLSDTDPKPPASAPFTEPTASPLGPDGPDEFAHIPSRRRPPVVALAATALAVFLAVRLRHDVGYALSPKTPVEVGDARGLGTRPLDDLPLNRYVRLRGQPERESAVVLDSRGAWKFTQFFRLRGTSGRVFVRRAADPLPLALAERDVFAGRLVKFGDLSFADSITSHFAARVTATHFFAPRALGAALAAGPPLQLSDRAGDAVTLAAGDRLSLDVARPGQYLIEVPRERAADLPRLKKLVTDDGGTIAGETESPELIALTATVPEAARDRVLSDIGQLGRTIRFRPARETLELRVSALAAADAGVRVQVSGDDRGTRVVPYDQILAVRTAAAVEVPKDALLLIEGEVPADETKSLLFLAFLSAFAVINLFGLRRAA
jgi:hypothetical protein